MRRLQIFKPVGVIGLLGLSLCVQACQQTTADPGSTLPPVNQQSGSGRSGPQNLDLGRSGNPSAAAKNEETREVTYSSRHIE